MVVKEVAPGQVVLECLACGRASLLHKQWCHLVYSRCGGSAAAFDGLPLIAWEREYQHVTPKGLSTA